MVALVKVFGIIIVMFGVIYLKNPNVMKEFVTFWKKENMLYTGGVLSILMGLVLLMAASQCTAPWVVVIFSLLALIKGLLIFVLKREKVMGMIEWWIKKPKKFLRTHAIVAIAIGVLLILSA